MTDESKRVSRPILVALSVIGLIVFGLFSLSSALTSLLGLPSKLSLAPALRLAGGVLLVAGLGLALWLFSYRNPRTMIVSTYFTFVKMFTRAPPTSGAEGRTEPLIVSGPHRYVRHPLYLGAAAMFLGWALVTDSTLSLVAAAFIVLCLRFVQIPFEERELRAIFGGQYVRYAEEVPMLIPFTKSRRRRKVELKS